MIKILELFGGIGAPRKALINIGIKHKVVDYVENDKNAVKSYNALYNENFKPQDIRNWNKNIKVDLLFHGSPCQDFSLEGKLKGAKEGSGTKSSLMWETIRIVKKTRPKIIIWENVKNVLSEKHKNEFNKYINTLNKLNYKSKYQVLNSKDYEIPQNRERLFVISILGENNFIFPEKKELNLYLKNFLEKNVNKKYYLSEEKINQITKYNKDDKVEKNFLKIKNATKKGFLLGKEGDGVDLSYPNSKTRRGRVQSKKCNTLKTNNNLGVIIKENEKLKIRKLTPKEYFRLQGFTDQDFEKIKNVSCESQLYKQSGNSITVKVLEHIFTNLLKEI